MKKRILFPVVAVLLALSAAFATEAMKDESNVFATVEYINGGKCNPDPNCDVIPTSTMCSNRFVLGSNCTTQVQSWLK